MLGSEVVGTAIPIWGAVSALLLIQLWRNRHVAFLSVVAFGLALNLAIVLLNSGMPVLSHDARLPSTSSSGTFYHLATAADVGVAFSDVLPVPGGWIVSLGDLLILVGVSAVIISAAHGQSDDRVLSLHSAQG